MFGHLGAWKQGSWGPGEVDLLKFNAFYWFFIDFWWNSLNFTHFWWIFIDFWSLEAWEPGILGAWGGWEPWIIGVLVTWELGNRGPGGLGRWIYWNLMIFMDFLVKNRWTCTPKISKIHYYSSSKRIFAFFKQRPQKYRFLGHLEAFWKHFRSFLEASGGHFGRLEANLEPT